MKNQIRLDVNPMMAEYVGEHGIARAEMEALSGAMRDAHAMVEAGRGKGMQGWMDLPYNQEAVVAEIEKTAKEIRSEFETFVVLGIGGSALGVQNYVFAGVALGVTLLISGVGLLISRRICLVHQEHLEHKQHHKTEEGPKNGR